jgi:hypothetical protein
VVWAEPGAEVSYPADSEQRNAPSHTSLEHCRSPQPTARVPS